MSNSTHLVQSIPADLVEFLHLTDGVLSVVRERMLDPRVLSLKSRFQKLGHVREVRVVSYEEILQLKKEDPTDANEEHSLTIQSTLDLFSRAVKERASDIHIRVHEGYAQVFFRVLGSMTKFFDWPAPFAASICSTIYQVMCDIADPVYNPGTYQDARIAKREYLPKGLHGIRVASGPKVGGVCMVLRLLYNDSGTEDVGSVERLTSLGYNETHVAAINLMMMRPSGINIIAGPTGSGKSTTLKHILEAISLERPELNILTVEDPPEYPIRGAVQMPVTNAATEEERRLAFTSAIRAALRMDPDVIMIGEIRDRESARLALQAAMTGHQVWATLHTNSAFGIITRLVELLASSEMPNPMGILADSTVFSGLVFQKLTKTLCPDCRQSLATASDRLDPDLFQRLSKVLDPASRRGVYVAGPGCDRCDGAAIAGRTVVSEVVATDESLLAVLRNSGVEAAKDFWVKEQFGMPVRSHAIEKIKLGIISPKGAEDVIGPLVDELVPVKEA